VLGAEQPAEVLRHFQQQLSSTKHPDLATRYGFLLAQLENKAYQDAYQTSLKFKQTETKHLAIKLAVLQAELKIKPAVALKQYQELLPFYPNHPAVIHDYAEALINRDKPESAQSLLNRFLKKHHDYPVFFKLLARIEAILNHQAASHQAMAEYYYQIGQLHQAIQQLDLALKQNNLDFYRLSQLEARQMEFKDELKQLQELE
jgi:predicted Zn-dependent protease